MSIFEKNHQYYSIYCIPTFGPPCMKCSDKANGLLFDLQCYKEMLLVPLSWSDGSRLWFCRVLSPLPRSLELRLFSF